jgi:hypothetical protein
VAGRATLAVLLGLGMLVPVLGHAAPVAAQASTVSLSTAEVAPADSIAYVVTTLDDQSEQWRLADVLLDRAGLGEALDAELGEAMKDEAGEDLPLDAFLGGEVGVIVGQTALDTLAEESMAGANFDGMMGEMDMASPEAETDDLAAQGFAIALDTRAPDTAWAGIQDSMSEESPEESTYEGTTILYTAPQSADDEGMAAARAGDLILIATTPVDLHPLIDTAEGRTPAITTVPEFTAVHDALPDEFLMFAYVNNAAIMNTDFGPMGMAAGTLGAESYSGMAITADEPGFRLESVALAGEGETLPAVAANFASELVEIAPDDTLFFSSAADLGASGVLDALGATLISIAFGMGDPTAAPDPDASPEDFIAEQYEMASSMIGINLQTDLFQQFSGEYGGWLTADLESENVSGVFTSGTEDPDTVANALMQLSFLIQGASGTETPLTTREVAGGQVYVIDLGDDAGSTLEFGLVGDRFVIGKGDAIDRFDGAPEESLASNPQFQAVMDTLPVEHNGVVYIDLVQAIPVFEVASEQSEDFDLGGFDDFPDASESCANYASQEEAQTAYDAAESGTFDLDQDFDGEVCEDFFVVETETPESTDETAEMADAFADVDYSGIKAFASVSYDDEGMNRSSAIIYISE